MVYIDSLLSLVNRLEAFYASKSPLVRQIWFSNVVGPQEEIVFFGHPIAYIAPSCFGQPNVSLLKVCLTMF